MNMKKILDFDRLLINARENLRAALKKIDEAGTRLIFITDESHKLLGSLSDGDVRRFILSGGQFDSPVLEAANKNCRYTINENSEDLLKTFKNKNLKYIPLTDANKKILAIYCDDETIKPKTKINLPVVIQAGGLGTRLYPYTQILPKSLIPICDKSITEHIIDSFMEYGCDNFYMIVNHKKAIIKAYFADIEKEYNLTFIDENVPLGTAGGLFLLKEYINTPFFLTNCDVLLDVEYSDIYKTHQTQKNIATIISAIKHYQIPYGVLNLNTKGKIESMTEKPNINYITNTGVYLLNNEIIKDLKPNASISMPEVLQNYLNLGESIGVYPISGECWNDMGQMNELNQMQKKYNM